MSKPDYNISNVDQPLTSGDTPFDYYVEAWKVVLDTIVEGVTIHSEDGKILYANERMADFYGVAVKDLLGLNCDEAFPKACNISRSGVALLSNDEIREGSDQVPGGYLRVLMKPLTDMRGTNRGYVRIVSEVTEQNVTTAPDKTADQLAITGQMIASLVHDVGTPLNIISGYAEYLLMRTDAEGKGYKELTTILQQTRRIAGFIKQIQDVIRPPGGQSVAIGLESILFEALNMAGHYLRKRSIRTSLICNPDLPMITCDVFRLRQAIFKILTSICEVLSPESNLQVNVKPASDNGNYLNVEFELKDRDKGKIESSQLFSVARNLLAGFDVKVSLRELDGEGTDLQLSFPGQNNRRYTKGEQ